MQNILFITGDGLPVCEVHLEKYIDEPSFLACQCDYDAWFTSHKEPMACKRCRGVSDERTRDEVDASLFEKNSSERGRGIAGSGTLDEKIVRQFKDYITNASYSE